MARITIEELLALGKQHLSAILGIEIVDWRQLRVELQYYILQEYKRMPSKSVKLAVYSSASPHL
jgi:hypothetical protein